MNVFEALKSILAEVQESEKISKPQKKQIQQWLSNPDTDIIQNIGKLVEISSAAGITATSLFSRLSLSVAPTCEIELNDHYFRSVPLPSCLEIRHLKDAMFETQIELYPK